MRLFDKSFWTFYAHTGVIPKAPASDTIGDPVSPLAVKAMSIALLAPGDDVLDPLDVAAKVEANTLRFPKPVLAMVPLQPQRLLSDAMGVPRSLVTPVHQSIATYLGDSQR